jgi:methylenetetrahydrofolate reductase (NADPH)
MIFPMEGCPKRMVHGPCGGVRPDLTCEVAPHPCPFAQTDRPVRWPGPTVHPGPPSRLLTAVRDRPVVLTDLTVPPFDPKAVAAVTDLLRGSCDALLVGEHQNRPDLAPALMARLVREAGGNPWTTLTCRDRTRIVLEQELGSLGPAGADGVLCVTGDGRLPGAPDGTTSVFDLDGTRLAALATSYGVGVAVAESPAAPPRALRPARLVEKQRAGAQLAVLNHAGGPAEVATFLAAARQAGLRIPVVASVAVYSDAPSARVLQVLPGLHLDPGRVAEVTGAADPEVAGVEAAVEEALAVLAVPGVAGVNLSGMASSRGDLHAATLKAEIGRRIREAVA